MLRVERVAAPVHAADISWFRERALHARRREQAVVAQALDALAAVIAICGRDAVSVVGGKFLRHQSRRRERERLRWRCDFARNIGLRHGPFFHGKNWDARIAIQHVEKSGFVALNYHRHAFAVVLQGGEQRGRCAVVIPQIVMNELKSPGEFAGFRVQARRWNRPICCRPRACRRNSRGWRCRWGRKSGRARDLLPSPTRRCLRRCATLLLRLRWRLRCVTRRNRDRSAAAAPTSNAARRCVRRRRGLRHWACPRGNCRQSRSQLRRCRQSLPAGTSCDIPREYNVPHRAG